ncbi:hypothetical protein PMAYCL1PPCAC_12771, partial [Pristionchus mayeri]
PASTLPACRREEKNALIGSLPSILHLTNLFHNICPVTVTAITQFVPLLSMHFPPKFLSSFLIEQQEKGSPEPPVPDGNPPHSIPRNTSKSTSKITFNSYPTFSQSNRMK